MLLTRHPYDAYLNSYPWQKPAGRGRTLAENRAAIAKVDYLYSEAKEREKRGGPRADKAKICTCIVGISYNGTYYKTKRKDGISPTPSALAPYVRAANNPGGPGRAKKSKTSSGRQHEVVFSMDIDQAVFRLSVPKRLQELHESLVRQGYSIEYNLI